MAFVIDSSQWHFDNLNTTQINQIIEDFLDRLQLAHIRREKIYIGDELQKQEVFQKQDFWSFFSLSNHRINPNLINELASLMNDLVYYEDDEDCWPPHFLEADAFDMQKKKLNIDQSFSHFHIIDHNPIACISLTDNRIKETKSRFGKASIHFVNSDSAHTQFWRSSLNEVVNNSEENLKLLAPHCYPNLYFHTSIWKQIKKFAGGYHHVRKQLQKYLAGLDDHGVWIFTAPPPAKSKEDQLNISNTASPSKQLIEQRFLHIQLDISPENPNVKQHTKSREAREVILANEIIYCEWHGKLEKHQNRVHIHPPLRTTNDETLKKKLIIAIFHEHLPLP